MFRAVCDRNSHHGCDIILSNTFLNVTAQPKYLFCDIGMKLYYNFIHCIFNICILSFIPPNPHLDIHPMKHKGDRI